MKAIPFTAAHTHIACIWEYPPPPRELPIRAGERIASTCVTESIVPVEDTGITEQESEYDSALDEEGDQLVHVQPERDP